MSVFEALMLICFGLSWPLSIFKTWKTKKVTGKSYMFIIVVALGYCSGIVHKALYNYDGVIWLYALNLLMVLVDLSLYFKYARRSGVA